MVGAATRISSITLMAPLIPSSMLSIMRWKISGEYFKPNGSLSHLNLPIGVLKVVRKEDSSSNFI